jgi:hypothetical protein
VLGNTASCVGELRFARVLVLRGHANLYMK